MAIELSESELSESELLIDPDLDEMWKAEIELRIDEIESGRVQGISGEDVMAKVRERFKES